MIKKIILSVVLLASYSIISLGFPVVEKEPLNKTLFDELKGDIVIVCDTGSGPVELDYQIYESDDHYILAYVTEYGGEIITMEFGNYIYNYTQQNCYVYFNDDEEIILQRGQSNLKVFNDSGGYFIKIEDDDHNFENFVNSILGNKNTKFNLTINGPVLTCFRGIIYPNKDIEEVCIYPYAKIVDLKISFSEKGLQCLFMKAGEGDFTQRKEILLSKIEDGMYGFSYLGDLGFRMPAYCETHDRLRLLELYSVDYTQNNYLLLKIQDDSYAYLSACVEIDEVNDNSVLHIGYQKIDYEPGMDINYLCSLAYGKFIHPTNIAIGPKESLRQEIEIEPIFEGSLYSLVPSLNVIETTLRIYVNKNYSELFGEYSEVKFEYYDPSRTLRFHNAKYEKEYGGFEFKESVYYNGDLYLYPFDYYDATIVVDENTTLKNGSDQRDYVGLIKANSLFESHEIKIHVYRQPFFYIFYFGHILVLCILFGYLKKYIKPQNRNLVNQPKPMLEILGSCFGIIALFAFSIPSIDYLPSIHTVIYLILVIYFVVIPIRNKSSPSSA